MYYLSTTEFEGFDLADYVYNYYHNKDAVMPSFIVKMVLFCAEIKRKINNKEISFSKGYREICETWGNLLGVVLETRMDEDEKIFFSGLMESIADE